MAKTRLYGAFALCLTPFMTPNAVLADGGQSSEFYAPTAWGPYDVGVMEKIIDAPHQRNGELEAWIWYPAEVRGDEGTYIYMENPLVGQMIGQAIDAPAFKGDAGPYPAIVFSHGNGGLAYQSIFMTEFLASHGYVVISVHHPHNTMLDYRPWTVPTGHITRPKDVSVQIDALEGLNQGVDSIFQDAIDLRKLGVSGHSFGGYTTLAVAGAKLDLNAIGERCAAPTKGVKSGGHDADDICALARRIGPVEDGFLDLSDPRVKAAVPLAPCGYDNFQPGGLAFVDIPIQLQGGGKDGACSMDGEIEPMYAAIPGQKSKLHIFDAGHFGWSDICLLAPDFEECHAPYFDMEEGHALINSWALSHFKVHLDGDLRYQPYLEADYAADFDAILSFESD